MKLNTFKIYTLILAALSFPTLVSSAPPINPNSPKAKHDWAFKLYQNSHCTGRSAEYTGIGSLACHSGIQNGGAKGFFKGHIDSACTVSLYKDDRCGRGNKVDEIHSNIDDKCKKASRWKKRIMSFDVTCS